MLKRVLVDKTSKEFFSYLESSGISKNSVKFYKSDLNHFTAWLLFRIRSLGVLVEELTQAIPFLKPAFAHEYKKFLIENNTPAKTINRKLSTLRNLSRFLTISQIINFDFAGNLTNITATGEEKYQIHPLVEGFQKHLEAEKVSDNTVKNYLADIRQFISRIAGNDNNRIKQAQITPEALKAYLKEISTRSNQATSKRKIASLKKFTVWAQKQGFIKSVSLFGKNITKKVFYASLQDKIIKRLEQKPRVQKIAHSLFYKRPDWYKTYHDISITNYIHVAILLIFSVALGFGAYDQFIKRTSSSLAYPLSSAPISPNRYLSFQGRLTDNLSNPITVSTNLVFKLYDAATAGNTLWNAAATACAITPDSDGIFSTLLGSTCGGAIAATVFSEYSDVWVGVTVGADSEATPRIQIATVGYALNAETLQGFPPSATGAINTVPLINNDGDLIISAASPTIQSTSGTFGIDGQAISIITGAASAGNITIAPDGTGQLLLTGGTATTDFIRA
ncbi:MAG: site-specific integrase, partial [bacterium]|nr:site-specific integrase [bacterium]